MREIHKAEGVYDGGKVENSWCGVKSRDSDIYGQGIGHVRRNAVSALRHISETCSLIVSTIKELVRVSN